MRASIVHRAGSYLGRRAALRLLPWAWPLYAGLGLYRAVEHGLTQRDRAQLRRLAQKSRGVPARLSEEERRELRRILAKLSPFTVARFIASEASPLPWPKPPSAS
jgi:hypothetical protein